MKAEISASTTIIPKIGGDEINEEKLILDLHSKDEAALEAIMERYSPLVSSVIANTAKGSLTTYDIEEAAADVFFCLWKNAKKIRPDRLKGYLCSIAKTKAKDKLKSLKLINMTDIDDIELMDSFDISEGLEREIIQRDITEALSQFSKTDREILMRYYYYYQTAPLIAETIGMKLEAVKSRIKCARPKLKAFFKERGY